MDILTVIGYIAGVFGLLATIASSIVIVKGGSTKETISQQSELINVLTAGKLEQKDQIATLQGQHAEAMKAISNMQGQIDVLKNIPLVNIDATLKELSQFTKSLSQSNELILKRLDTTTPIKPVKHNSKEK